MKIKFFLFLAILFIGFISNSQNILPFTWKVSFLDTDSSSETKDRKSVNLLLSWERQGYSWMNGSGTMVADFDLPESVTDSDYLLAVNLQCDVHKILINGNSISGFIQNHFWSDRDQESNFTIPSKFLKKDKINRIEIEISNLQYTGGLSHNKVQLTPANQKITDNLKIIIKPDDHVYSSSVDVKFDIKTKTSVKGNIGLLIKNDFSDTVFMKSFKAQKGESVTIVD
ncbi:MAG: hypothetical protein JXR31_14945, partial [Prolixibacteraceae bacterium]|nr:hypothetical protein [Prolixibacteraceae bacterium]